MNHGSVVREDIIPMLRERDINPTSQRVEIAFALFSRCAHLSAEDVFEAVNRERSVASKATVYNTLGLYVRKGLVREVIADPARTFYDPNTAPHHHFYDVATGRLTDIDQRDVDISRLPALPEGTELEGVDVIVRLRHTQAQN
jgi:Fur family iron response transcriptional regulator